MATRCFRCRTSIPEERINVTQGIAHCPSCGALWRLLDLASQDAAAAPHGLDPSTSPAGCRMSTDGDALVLSASTRSFGGFCGALAICLFWNFIVGTFFLLVIDGFMRAAGMQPPPWLPGKPSTFTSAWGPLFVLLFITPHLCIGMMFIWNVMLKAAGECRVSIRNDDGRVFTGVGPLGRTRRFTASEVTAVHIHAKKDDESVSTVVAIAAHKLIKFGSDLAPIRQLWMQSQLSELLVGPHQALENQTKSARS